MRQRDSWLPIVSRSGRKRLTGWLMLQARQYLSGIGLALSSGYVDAGSKVGHDHIYANMTANGDRDNLHDARAADTLQCYNMHSSGYYDTTAATICNVLRIVLRLLPLLLNSYRPPCVRLTAFIPPPPPLILAVLLKKRHMPLLATSSSYTFRHNQL